MPITDQMQEVPQESQRSDVSRIIAGQYVDFEPRWKDFLKDHGDWFHRRSAEAHVVYALPVQITDSRLMSLFETCEDSVTAEREYTTLCSVFFAVTVSNSRPIPYRWLQPVLKAPADKWLGELRSLGCDDSDIRDAKSLNAKCNGIAERLMGSAGRLVCSPSFRAARDKLRARWESLPAKSKLAFPLSRSVKVSCNTDLLDVVPVNTELTEFTAAFDQFCDAWRIVGMATWDLPDLDGPKWPEMQLPAEQHLAGRVTYDTPWHFCLLADDGLGLAREEHDQLAAEKNIEDHLKWQTYANLFLIDFWENALRSRYSEKRRRKGFVTALLAVIADVVQLDVERVQRLRKRRSALMSGRLSSLAGKR